MSSLTPLLPTSKTFIDGQGIQDAIRGDAITIDIEQPTGFEQDTNDVFDREDMLKNMSYASEGLDCDDDDGLMPFERMSKQMDDISGDGCVMKQVLKAGSGQVVPEDSIVRVHYNAYLEMAAEPYDSTRLRNKPHKFRLGSHDVLTGFDVAVSTMCKGELSRYLISSRYALGESGCPPRVPPNANLMMEIELLSFIQEGGVEDFFLLTNEEKGKLDFSQIRKVTNTQREEGNVHVREGLWHRAMTKYKKAADILENVNLKDEVEQKEQQKILVKLYLNMSLCCLKQNSYPHVIHLCTKALDIDTNNIKAMFRKAQAFRHLSEFTRAKEWLIKARKISPNNPDISQEFVILETDKKKFDLLDKEKCKRMFKPQGSASAIAQSQTMEDAKQQKDTSDILTLVSDEFKAMVDSKLGEFATADEETELPYPGCNLSVPEIGYITKAAVDRNLEVLQVGEGYNLKLKIIKK